jgi:phosphatidylinositol dimannoside acyltransferase
VKPTALSENSRHFLNIVPIYTFGEMVLESLPFEVGYTITRIVAEIAYRFSPRHRAAMEANVRHVLRATQPELGGSELDRLVRETTHRIFWSRGTAYADNTVMATRLQLDDRVRFEKVGNWAANLAQIARARASGRGVILASGHLGNWYSGGLLLSQEKVPTRTVMYRNNAMHGMVQKLSRRGKIRHSYVDRDPFAMAEIVRALRSGEVLMMMADIAWDSRTIEVPFFGRPAKFPIGPFRLARLAEALIFPAFCTWKRRLDYAATLGDPIELRGDDPDRAERDAAGRFAAVLEREVAAHLTQWLNFTPVWDAP